MLVDMGGMNTFQEFRSQWHIKYKQNIRINKGEMTAEIDVCILFITLYNFIYDLHK